jgi:predicted ATP-grasp superfamily ATP-dependent carboligase
MNKAIVIGGIHHNTLGIIRGLGIKGVYPDAYIITKTGSAGSVKSKYIDKTVLFENAHKMLEHLLATASSYKDKVVLYAAGDEVSAIIDMNFDRLKEKYVFFNAAGTVHEWMNKEKMSSLAASLGMNVPRHFVQKVGEALPDDIEYPCITKAISSIDGDKSDTTICHNGEELDKFLSTSNLCPLIQIEKFIKKEFEFQFIGVSLNKGETIVIPGHSHIERPNGIQNTYFFNYISNDETFTDTLEKAKDFIRAIGYSGHFSVEFLRGIDGKDYFLEMNFRNDGNAICVVDAGFNIPYIWYLWATGGDYLSEITNSSFKRVCYCPEMFYVLQCSYGEVPFFTFVRDLLKANSFTNYYKGDSPHFWGKFIWFAFKQLAIKKPLIRMGILSAPKESIG